MSLDQDATKVQLLEIAAVAMERAVDAQQEVAAHGLVIRIGGIPYLNPAAQMALDERRLVVEALALAQRLPRRWIF